MNRRELIKRVGLALGGITISKYLIGEVLAKTKETTPTTPPFKGPLSIGQILTVAFPAVMFEMRGKGKRQFVTPELEALYKSDKILLRSLGTCIEEACDPGPNKIHQIQEVSIPCVWSLKDEAMNTKESHKINLVKNLLENLIYSHDEILLDKIGSGQAVISKEYNYSLGQVCELPSQNAFVVKLYTAGAFLT